MKSYYEKLTADVAARIGIPRYSEDSRKGYQRKLNSKKVTGIVEWSQKQDAYVPAIGVAVMPDGRLFIMDGQHRLEAWRIKPYDLGIEFRPLNKMVGVVDNFIKINTAQTKTALALTSAVSLDPTFVKMRDLAIELKCDHTVVLYFIRGFMKNNHITPGSTEYDVPNDCFSTAKIVLSAIINKQKKIDKDGGFLGRSFIEAVGIVVRDGQNKDTATVAKAIAEINLKKGSPIRNMYGSSRTCVARMRDHVIKKLHKSMA